MRERRRRLDRLETAATTLKEQLQEGRTVDDAMPNPASSAPRGRLKTLDAHRKGRSQGARRRHLRRRRRPVAPASPSASRPR